MRVFVGVAGLIEAVGFRVWGLGFVGVVEVIERVVMGMSTGLQSVAVGSSRDLNDLIGFPRAAGSLLDTILHFCSNKILTRIENDHV